MNGNERVTIRLADLQAEDIGALIVGWLSEDASVTITTSAGHTFEGRLTYVKEG